MALTTEEKAQLEQLKTERDILQNIVDSWQSQFDRYGLSWEDVVEMGMADFVNVPKARIEEIDPIIADLESRDEPEQPE